MNRPVLIGISAIVAGIVLAGCAATSPSTSAEEESAGEGVAVDPKEAKMGGDVAHIA